MQMQDLSESLLFEERPNTPKIEVNDQVMDENEEDERPESPFVRKLSKVRKKMDDLADDISREIKDELHDQKKHIKKAENCANDLVDPDTLDRLKEIIFEKPEIEQGIDWALWYHITTKSVTYVLLKVVDIVTDCAAAYQHFKRDDVKYGALTLFFVYLPGFVISVGFTYWGFTAPRAPKEEAEDQEPSRKPINCRRFLRYMGVLFIFPLLYPFIQILLGFLLVALLVRRRDHEPLKFMGHDLKQFKSLEGFLESGPQFALQSYILLIGQKKDTNIDFNNITEDDAERLAILCFSILVSFISLTKTAVNVNIPDPDPRRQAKQYKHNVPYCKCCCCKVSSFKISLSFFTFFCVIFRLLSLAVFLVYLRGYTMILIVTAFLSNVAVLAYVGTSISIIIILGAISIFVPNGYLLYNFAGTLIVDFPRRGSKAFYMVSTLVVNMIWLAGNIAVILLGIYSELPGQFVIRDTETQHKFVNGMNIALIICGTISSILGLIHWFCCIEKLFIEPQEQGEL